MIKNIIFDMGGVLIVWDPVRMLNQLHLSEADNELLNRELLRLETSLKAAGEKPIFCFLHYPPLYQGYQCPEILSMLEAYKVELCCYGHLHGPVIRRRQEGKYGNTEFSLISGDYLGFVPKKICEK